MTVKLFAAVGAAPKKFKIKARSVTITGRTTPKATKLPVVAHTKSDQRGGSFKQQAYIIIQLLIRTT